MKKDKLKEPSKDETALSSSDGELETKAWWKEVGGRIAEVRGKRTQPEYAKFYNVHKNTIGRYERGDRPPDIDFIMAMNVAEHIEPYWLLTGEGPMIKGMGIQEETATYTTNSDLTEAGIKWFKAIKNIDDDFERLSILTAIFGRSAATFINMEIEGRELNHENQGANFLTNYLTDKKEESSGGTE